MAATIRDCMSRNACGRLVGRHVELATLRQVLTKGSPAIVHLHGMSGMGKSAILAAFAQEAREAGATVLAVECGGVEPTERGVLAELGEALDCGPRLKAIATALAARPGPTLLAFDAYELFGLVDTWIRRRLLPILPEHTLILLASRLPPAIAWTGAPELQGMFRVMLLGSLSAAEATALLMQLGVPRALAPPIVGFAAGHPLALTLAAGAALSPSSDSERPLEKVIPQLAHCYLGAVDNAEARNALRAASIARRINVSLLRALRPEADPNALYGVLAELPFVTALRDGLAVHEAVREALSADLEATDPELHRHYRREAWRQLSHEAKSSPVAELWRYTADLIYLIRNPVVRDAFFPHEAMRFAMEPAQPEDRRAILAVTRRHDGRAGAELMDAWLEAAPHAFFVARSPGGGVEGFYTLIDAADTAVARLRIDTAVARFMRDIAECPLAAGQSALLLRRWLSLGEGEGPSAVQAACWLDIKRHYMERRPELRRVYMALAEFGPYAAAANTLGIAALPDRVPIGNRSMQTAMLDMGPGSVDGWLSRLAATELGVALQDCLLDKVSRALRVNGQLVALTRREFDVMAYLAARRDEAVPRDALIHDVWGLRFDAGSNVVDVVVASLRRKLGCYSGVIETMRGYGYVYRGTSMDKASARV